MTSQPTPGKISYRTLVERPEEVHDAIVASLGSGTGALGVILVDDLPEGFPDARERLFRLGYAFAALPEAERERLARPETLYSFGWSHGKEVMNGRPDTAKGSFYANPLLDKPRVSDEQRAAHPEYYAGNVWPQGIEVLEDFEAAFKALGEIIAQVGVALAKACEKFVDVEGRSIADLISSSQSNKARLLHYFPTPPSAASDGAADDACGTHLDHSLLTGLCSAMYLAPGPTQVPPPDARAGLYIYPRGSKDAAVRVQIPPTCLAFQTGEALELLTAGRLAATPHYVSAGGGSEVVSRETFAFFLQPDVDDVVGPDGETFGAFTKRVLARHYGDAA